MKKRRTIGLALGSGAYRGFAHIGVIKSLEKHGITIDYLSGASSGAWMAAHYAIFKDSQKLADDFINNSQRHFSLLFDFWGTGGIISGKKFFSYLETLFLHRKFSSLQIPLEIVATDLRTGRPFIFKSGNVAQAVRASTSVPLIFNPVQLNGKFLGDGGMSNPVPCSLVKEMGADIVIGVNLYSHQELSKSKPSLSDVAWRSTVIMLRNLSTNDLLSADIAIDLDLSRFVSKNSVAKYFTKEIAEEMIKVGEKETDKIIAKIKKLL